MTQPPSTSPSGSHLALWNKGHGMLSRRSERWCVCVRGNGADYVALSSMWRSTSCSVTAFTSGGGDRRRPGDSSADLQGRHRRDWSASTWYFCPSRSKYAQRSTRHAAAAVAEVENSARSSDIAEGLRDVMYCVS